AAPYRCRGSLLRRGRTGLERPDRHSDVEVIARRRAPAPLHQRRHRRRAPAPECGAAECEITPTGPIEEADLHACIDGQLPPERAASVEVYIAGHSAERARLSRYAEQQRAALAAQASGP